MSLAKEKVICSHPSHLNKNGEATNTNHRGGSITVWLVSSLTRLELTSEGNINLFVFSEAV